MSWTEKLFETYENNVGRNDNEILKKPLVPISHGYFNAQVELTINSKGEFVKARKIKKEDAATLIPVTEKSASRSSGIAPHPLADTLSYMAGDYYKYCLNEKEVDKSKQKNDSYMKQLYEWSKYDNSHPKVKTIYNYLEKKCLIEDLIQAGLIGLENGKFDNKKIEGATYDKALVRIRIIGFDGEECTWKDMSLIDNYCNYYNKNQTSDKSVCYVTGKLAFTAINHPKGIVSNNYGSKLISSNDTAGFTFRGRFTNSNEACTISYEASQKIHAALTWLVSNYGNYQKGRTYICWNPQRKKVVDVFNFFDVEDESFSDNKTYKKRLYDILSGYMSEFEEDDEVIFIGLDAATTGRLSVTYYSEQNAKVFINSVKYWSESFQWFFKKWDEKKKLSLEMQTPSFWKVINCAFGTEKAGRLDVDDRIYKEQIQRLVKCLVDRQPFPYDIVHALKNKASKPSLYHWEKGYSNNWDLVFSVACAVLLKYRIDRNIIKKEVLENMQLDKDNHNRSYLFGRLLAVLEIVERKTYVDESREPNAIRLMGAFVNHPMQTWQNLDKILNPYYQRLNPGTREYYRKIISEITVSFKDEDRGIMNQPLKEDYLLGYYLQRAELKEFNKKRYEEEI